MTTGNIGLRLDCLYQPPLATAEADYLRYLGRLLNSPPRLVAHSAHAPKAGSEPPTAQSQPDLLLYWERERPFWQRWLGLTSAVNVVNHTSSSVLVGRQPSAQRPCWPIHRILLILRADKSDDAALRWLAKLAQPTRAKLFVLPIIPPVPAMYRHGRIPLDIEVLLASNTYSGAQLRRLAALCAAWGIQGELLLQNSDPQHRIAWAAATSDCDLILISDEPYPWLHRCLLGELVRPLLRQIHRPILIAREQASLHG